MPFLLAGVAALLLLIFGARFLASVDARKLAAVSRKVGGVALLSVAALLLMRGVLLLAIPLAAFGLALIGVKGGLGTFFGGSARKSPGQKSHIRTEALEMELDHDSGRMEGRCLKGKFAGRELSALSLPELLTLLDELRAHDGQDAALLEAYLDRRSPGWRGEEEAGGETPRPGRARSSRMGVDEAYAVLGLKADASVDDIRDAHRRLMKKLHPDQGGSTYLAARINEAKEVLLGRKRAR